VPDTHTPVSWLVTGARGQLGGDLLPQLAARNGDTVTALGRADLDLTDEPAVRATVRAWLARARAAGGRPVLLNAAAYTAVDAAETDEATARLVNGAAPGWLAEELAAAADQHARLVHVSTDYVFDGTATQPYPVHAPTAPRTAYGRTKAAGEHAIAQVTATTGGDATVVRTSWVYARHGANFVRTMARLAATDRPVDVVDDQIGSPTWAAGLAAGLIAAGAHPGPLPPLLHYSDAGAVSWFGFARAVFAELGADPERVRPTTTAAFPRPAPRPAYSVLDTAGWTAAGLPAPRPWRDTLHQALSGGLPD
jgi:dTDP-4-dehydrorhamnose reductase